MLKYARATTLAAVEGLTLTELDHLHDDRSNSIGALLAHIVAVERAYQILTFEDRALSAEEEVQWSAALDQGLRLLAPLAGALGWLGCSLAPALGRMPERCRCVVRAPSGVSWA